ncbi:MAG: cation:proton antiporter [Acidobacteria bacterium]|nr:cation:proton antiporter [Acidobacteriota bacterium]
MRRLAALALLLGSVLVARRTMAGDAAADLRTAALAFGFALIAAALAGGLVERLKLPRISGYLLFGLACGPQAADLISRAMASELGLVNGLAIALIAFIAGLEINLARVRDRLRGIVILGVSVIVVTFVVLGTVIYVFWPSLPIAPEATGAARLAMTLTLTTVLVSFSPTVTIAVIAESRARGPLTELALAVVVLADLALILGFTIVMQYTRSATGVASSTDVGLLPFLSWDIVGSLAFGAGVGALFAFYLNHVSRELTLSLLALCVIMSVAGETWQFEPLLSALAAGMVVENIAPPRGDALKLAIERGALPVLVVFFAAAGASLQLDALAKLGALAVGLATLRLVAVWLGTNLGVKHANLDFAAAPLLWMALISQAGVTLGLTMMVSTEFPDWGAQIQTLMVALIAIHELVGPILFRSALAKAGEIGKMDS